MFSKPTFFSPIAHCRVSSRKWLVQALSTSWARDNFFSIATMTKCKKTKKLSLLCQNRVATTNIATRKQFTAWPTVKILLRCRDKLFQVPSSVDTVILLFCICRLWVYTVQYMIFPPRLFHYTKIYISFWGVWDFSCIIPYWNYSMCISIRYICICTLRYTCLLDMHFP